MKSGFKKQLWISVSVIVVAIAAAAVGIYILSGDLDANAQSIIRQKNLVAAQSASVGILASLEGQAPKAATYATAMQMLIPSHDALIGFSTWLNGIAQSDGVTASFSFTGSDTPATLTTAGTDTFSLAVQGSLTAIATFLENIEYQAPGFLLSIDTFSLVSEGGNYTLNGQGRVFSQESAQPGQSR
jgi:hypothetical protein